MTGLDYGSGPWMQDIPRADWRPEIDGWSEDILPYYRAVALGLPPDAVVVEVGVAHGRSAVYLAEQLLELGRDDVELWCVDSWPGPEFRKILATLAAPELHAHVARMRIVRCDGVRAARLFPLESVGLLFIDSDHGYEGMRAHLSAWDSRIAPGGRLAGHDYSSVDWPGVVRAVDEHGERAGRPMQMQRPTRTVFEFRYTGDAA